MCGRFALFSPIDEIDRNFNVGAHIGIPQRYNIAPSQPALVVRHNPEGRTELAALEWGLVPEWKKERPSKPLINARLETVEIKPSFRASVKRSRCLIPFNGWYEWRSENGVKQPYFIADQNQSLQAFAGIWSVWHGPGGDHWLETFAIVTAAATGPIRRLHKRKPLVVPPAHYEAWMTTHDPLPRGFLDTFEWVSEEQFGWHAVSRRVNSIQNDDSACLEPAEAPKQPSLF